VEVAEEQQEEAKEVEPKLDKQLEGEQVDWDAIDS
jgi:hypothetical protein